MTLTTLQNEIEEAVPKLLDIARELTWDKLSGNCKFILTEIKNSEENFHVQTRLTKKENDQKIPVSLQELMQTLRNLYANFYDVNLHIYKATENLTIVDIRYYPKSSLDNEYRQKVLNNQPMLHCKVSMPPWVSDKKEKFDINWEHNGGLNKWKLFWLRLKLKTKSG